MILKRKFKWLRGALAEEFEVKDLGELKYFLGMLVAKTKSGIVVSQRNYVLDLLEEIGLLGCKLTETPMMANYKWGLKQESPPVDTIRYQ